MMKKNSKRVLIAMSGGVDSAVAAARTSGGVSSSREAAMARNPATPWCTRSIRPIVKLAYA